jgi:transcriptional regulator with XRE-family HTH domain
MYYSEGVVSGDLIREARLRVGLTQAELARRLGTAQSVVARWERGDVQPSLESLRRVVAGCGLELGFSLSKRDDASDVVIDEHLRMSPAERFADLLARVRFHEQLQRRTSADHG